MESNIPPMLAAQSAFPSGPLPGFHKIFRSTNLEIIHKLQVSVPRFAGLKLRKNLGRFLNGAEFTAHGTDIGLLRHAGLPKLPGPQGIDGEPDLLLPVQGSPGPGHQAIFFQGTFETSGNVCGMAGNPGGNDPIPYIINRGKPKVF